MPPRRSSTLLAAGLLALAVALAGCGGAPGGTTGAQRTVTDTVGRAVVVPATVSRVVTVGSVPVLNSFPFAVGEGATIVNGIPGGDTSTYRSYEAFAPALLTAPTVQSAIGQPPNVEAVFTLKPDVVFTSERATADRLQGAGIPTVVLSLETGDKIKDSVRVTGAVFDRPQQAQDYIAYFDDTVRRVDRISATIPAADRPTVLYVNLKPLRRPNRIMEFMLDHAAADSVTRDVPIGQYQFGVEQLQQWNPQMLIGMRPEDRPGLLGDPRFAALQAVRSNRIGIIPTGVQIWGNNTTEQPLGLLWVATFLHPAQFASIDLPAETKQFYQRFYRVTLTDDQTTRLLAAGW